MSPNRESLGAGTVYNLVARFAFVLSGYGIHIGLARVLGPDYYGVVGLLLSLVTIASVLVMNGARQAISKFTAEDERLATAIRGAALRVQGLFSISVAALMLVGAGLLAGLWRDPELAPYIRLAAPIVPLMALQSVYLASLNGLRAFGRQAAVTILYSGGRVVLALAGAWLWGLPGAVAGLVAGPLVAVAVARLLLPATPRQGRFPARDILAFSVPMIVFSVAATVLTYLDLYFVQACLGQGSHVGYYTSAATVARVPYYALLALTDTLAPVTSRLVGQGERERARLKITTGLRYGLMLLLPAGALVSATARPLLGLVYSRPYAAAGGALAVLIWGQIAFAFFSVLTALLAAEGRPGRAMTLGLALLPVSAALNAVLVPRWGLVGAAWATTATTLLGLALSLVVVQRDFGPTVRARSLLSIGAVALVCGALAACWRPHGVMLPVAYAVLLGAGVLLLWLARELGRDDLERLWALVRRRRGVAA